MLRVEYLSTMFRVPKDMYRIGTVDWAGGAPDGVIAPVSVKVKAVPEYSRSRLPASTFL